MSVTISLTIGSVSFGVEGKVKGVGGERRKAGNSAVVIVRTAGENMRMDL